MSHDFYLCVNRTFFHQVKWEMVGFISCKVSVSQNPEILSLVSSEYCGWKLTL